MRLGKAWIVIENSIHTPNITLISVINPKRSSSFVRQYLEQIYVDKYASFSEKIAYKKHPKNSAYRIESYECSSTVISCGHDPTFRAFHCHELKIENGLLLYKYRVMSNSTKNDEYHGKVKIA